MLDEWKARGGLRWRPIEPKKRVRDDRGTNTPGQLPHAQKARHGSKRAGTGRTHDSYSFRKTTVSFLSIRRNNAVSRTPKPNANYEPLITEYFHFNSVRIRTDVTFIIDRQLRCDGGPGRCTPRHAPNLPAESPLTAIHRNPHSAIDKQSATLLCHCTGLLSYWTRIVEYCESSLIAERSRWGQAELSNADGRRRLPSTLYSLETACNQAGRVTRAVVARGRAEAPRSRRLCNFFTARPTLLITKKNNWGGTLVKQTSL